MKKIITTVIVCCLTMMLLAGIASAHVTVYPKESTQGAHEKFTVRVPNEKDIPTVKVEVTIPADVNITRFEPKPGWSYELTQDPTDKITSVIWTTTEDGLSATEFAEFNMQGKVGDRATAIEWKAYQQYEDGSVVEWIGAVGSDKPASVTTVKEKPVGTEADSEEQAANSNLPLFFSIAAFVLSLLALFFSFRKQK